jgi:hypothetical protein
MPSSSDLPLPSGLLQLLIIVIVVFAVLVILARLLQRKPVPPYVVCDSLLTPGEMVFWRTLEKVVPPTCRVMMKVRLIDILTVPAGTDSGGMWRAKVKQKHCDFVLVDAISLRPVMVIELNDRSHDRADRRERDAFLADAMNRAGLPLVFIKAANSYDARALKQTILTALHRP